MSVNMIDLPLDIIDPLFSHLTLTEQYKYAQVNKRIYYIWRDFLSRNIVRQEIQIYLKDENSFNRDKLITRLRMNRMFNFIMRDISLILDASLYKTNVDEYYFEGPYTLFMSYNNNKNEIKSQGYFHNNKLVGLSSYTDTGSAYNRQIVSRLNYNLFLDDQTIEIRLTYSTITLKRITRNKRSIEEFSEIPTIERKIEMFPYLAYPSSEENILRFIDELYQSDIIKTVKLLSFEDTPYGSFYYYMDKKKKITARFDRRTGILINTETGERMTDEGHHDLFLRDLLALKL